MATRPLWRPSCVGRSSTSCRPVADPELHERWANSLALNGADDAAVVSHLLATESELGRRSRPRKLRARHAADCSAATRRLRNSAYGDYSTSARLSEESSLRLDLAACEVRLGRPSAVTSLQEALARGVHGERVIAVARATHGQTS